MTDEMDGGLALLPTEHPRPRGPGWRLVDYLWDESNGIAQLVYRSREGGKEAVAMCQPAGKFHPCWSQRPPIDHDAVLARYFETIRDQLAKQADGVYVTYERGES